MNKYLRYLPLLLLLPLIAHAAPDVAQTVTDTAQAATDATNSALSFRPPQTDVSVVFLGNIFGLVDGVLYGSGSQIMGKLFGVFNAAVLALGGIVVMYTLIVSTLNTAHEGQMLGKKWSSIWIPLRSTLACALLLPKKSGYCVIQIFVMWVVVQGVGAADKVFNAGLNYLRTGGMIVERSTPTPTSDAAGTSMVDQSAKLLKALVCMEGLQRSLEQQRDAGANIVVPDFSSAVTAKIDSIAADPKQNKVLGTSWKINIPTVDSSTTTDSSLTSLDGACGDITIQSLSQDNVTAIARNLSPDSETDWGGIAGNLAEAFGQVGVGMAQGAIQGAGALTEGAGDVGQSVGANVSGIRQAQDSINGVNDDINRRKGAWTIDKLIGMYGLPLSDENVIKDHNVARLVAMSQMVNDLDTTARAISSNFFTSQGTNCSQLSANKQSCSALPYGYLKDAKCVADGNCPEGQPSEWLGGSQGQTTLLTGYEVKNAVKVYDALMRPTVRAITQAISGLNFIKSAQKKGWLMAGSYFFDMAKLNSQGGSAAQDKDHPVINSTPPTVSSDMKTVSSNGKSYVAGAGDFQIFKQMLDSLAGRASETPVPATENNPGISQQDIDAKVIGKAIDDQKFIWMQGDVGQAPGQLKFEFKYDVIPPIEKTDCWGTFCIGGSIENLAIMLANLAIIPQLNVMYLAFQTYLIPFTKLAYTFSNQIFGAMSKGVPPIIAIASLGNEFINVASASLVGFIALAVTGGLIPAISSPTTFFIVVTPFITMILTAMFAMGFMMAFYIPLIPYILYTFAALGWFVAVIEAMVAAPIVALGLAHPEGSEAWGKAEPAVMLITNVFLRPSMMVIGFFAGFILSYVSVWMLNAGFVYVANGLTANIASGFGSIFAPLVMTGIYIVLAMQLIQRSFDLIHMIPDKILRWLSGGNAEELGGGMARGATEPVKSFTSSAGQQTARAGQQAGSGVAKAGSQTGSGSISKGGGGGDDAGLQTSSAPKSPTGDKGESGADEGGEQPTPPPEPPEETK